MKSNPKFGVTIGLLGILAGSLIGYQQFSKFIGVKANNNGMTFSSLERSNPSAKQKEIVQGKPVRISIPALGIDLKVGEGHYDEPTKSWTLSDTQAMYAVMTPYSNNQAGNTFIYGHSTSQVFEKLPNLKAGELAEVYTDNNHKFVYKFQYSFETSPDDSSLLSYNGAPILTLQTCSGIWSQNRFLMTFKLVEYS